MFAPSIETLFVSTLRSKPHRRWFLAISANVFVAVAIAGCAPTPVYVPQVISAPMAAAQASPPPRSVNAPGLDLCPLPNIAPADLRSKPGYVEFAVSPIDAKGSPILHLTQSDFLVSEGSASYPIAHFSENPGQRTPASIIIIDDASATMSDKTNIRTANSRARAALDKNGDAINECDEVGVVTVGGRYSPYFKPELLGERDPRCSRRSACCNRSPPIVHQRSPKWRTSFHGERTICLTASSSGCRSLKLRTTRSAHW